MTQRQIRNALKKMMCKYGTTQTFIAKNTNLSQTTINLFLKNERDLKTEEVKARVEKFIKDRI